MLSLAACGTSTRIRHFCKTERIGQDLQAEAIAYLCHGLTVLGIFWVNNSDLFEIFRVVLLAMNVAGDSMPYSPWRGASCTTAQ
jgi:hypothetical protein